MSAYRAVLVVATALTAAACVPRAAPPPPSASPARPAPVPTAAPAPPPASTDWRDWPLSAGTWRYENGRASFGQNAATLLALTCDRGARRVTFSVAGQGAGPLTVRTSSASRSLPVSATPGTLDAGLAASDPLLDAVGFSRGRFVVERPGTPALVVPAYPEFLRVIEDCRG